MTPSKGCWLKRHSSYCFQLSAGDIRFKMIISLDMRWQPLLDMTVLLTCPNLFFMFVSFVSSPATASLLGPEIGVGHMTRGPFATRFTSSLLALQYTAFSASVLTGFGCLNTTATFCTCSFLAGKFYKCFYFLPFFTAKAYHKPDHSTSKSHKMPHKILSSTLN